MLSGCPVTMVSAQSHLDTKLCLPVIFLKKTHEKNFYSVLIIQYYLSKVFVVCDDLMSIILFLFYKLNLDVVRHLSLPSLHPVFATAIHLLSSFILYVFIYIYLFLIWKVRGNICFSESDLYQLTQ